MQGLEEEAEEDVGGEQDEGEGDGAAKASPCAHDVLFFLFLGFLFPCRLPLGGGWTFGAVVAVAGQAGIAIGGGCLFHARLVGWWGRGLVFGWCFVLETDVLLRFAPGCCCAWRFFVLAGGDTGFRDGLVGLQQALRADNDAVVGDELLVADLQFLTAFGTSPAHSLQALGSRF